MSYNKWVQDQEAEQRMFDKMDKADPVQDELDEAGQAWWEKMHPHTLEVMEVALQATERLLNAPVSELSESQRAWNLAKWMIRNKK